MAELIDVPLRLPVALMAKIAFLASQCGLTPEQMASAIFVLLQQDALDAEEPQ